MPFARSWLTSTYAMPDITQLCPPYGYFRHQTRCSTETRRRRIGWTGTREKPNLKEESLLVSNQKWKRKRFPFQSGPPFEACHAHEIVAGERRHLIGRTITTLIHPMGGIPLSSPKVALVGIMGKFKRSPQCLDWVPSSGRWNVELVPIRSISTIKFNFFKLRNAQTSACIMLCLSVSRPTNELIRFMFISRTSA